MYEAGSACRPWPMFRWCCLYFDEETGVDRAAFSNINTWSQRIAALPGWAHPYDLMKRGFAQK